MRPSWSTCLLLIIAQWYSALSWSQPSQIDCAVSNEAEGTMVGLLGAHRHISFRGTLLYERAGSRQFIDVDWSAGAGEARLRRLNRVADPASETWSPPVLSVARFCDLLGFYVPRVEQGRVIAGRSTRRLTLQPRDTLRLGYIVDVDGETGLPLGMMTADPEGKILERYEFASIDLSGENDAFINPELAIGDESAESDLRGRSVLPGYYVVKGHATPAAFVVTDGLATASVFLEPLPSGAAPGEAGVIEGATLAYTRGVSVAGQKGVLISVLGEVPMVTARLLADAIRPTNDNP